MHTCFLFLFIVLLSFGGVFCFSPENKAEASSTKAASKCPNWIEKEDVPPCPSDKEASLLSDNYPALAHVVSENSSTERFVLNVLETSGPRLPMMFLIVSAAKFEKIKSGIHQRNDLDESTKAAWINSLVRVPSPAFTWQQDYFEAVTDKVSRKQVLRAVPNYDQGNSTSDLFSAMAKACDKINVGAPFDKNAASKIANANMGGNMEALPGGLCLHGKNQPSKYALAYCTSKENEVVIDTDWLEVGHADEIVGTIPRPGKAFPCNFALTFASPRKGLAAIADPAHGSEYFFGAPSKAARERAWGSGSLYKMCWKIQAWELEKRKNEGRGRKQMPARPEEKDHTRLWNLLVRNVWAGEVKKKPCSEMTNADVAGFFKSDPAWTITQELIQNKMDVTKKEILKRVKSRLPQCEVEGVDQPYLFGTGELVENPDAPPGSPNGKKYALPNKMALALIPNATNAVVSGNSILVPDPHHLAFKQEIEAGLKKVGTDAKFIDTYHYAHTQQGNLHCATHTVRTCR